MHHYRAKGFTLVEIAIVLVIIGLLLGGVLKGQEMIEGGRVRNLVNDFNGLSVAVNAYRDRYRQLPGDDGPSAEALQQRGGSWASVSASGNQDGVLQADSASWASAEQEGVGFWQQLRAAGLITGNAGDRGTAALPRNPWGGQTNVAQSVQGMSGLAVCSGNMPGKAAVQIDRQLDDGNNATGSVRAVLAAASNGAPGASAPSSAAYDESLRYTLCREI